MPIWIEALLGLAAIVLVAVACWREDRLIAWEDRHLIPPAKRNERSETNDKGSERI